MFSPMKDCTVACWAGECLHFPMKESPFYYRENEPSLKHLLRHRNPKPGMVAHGRNSGLGLEWEAEGSAIHVCLQLLSYLTS